MEYDKMKVTELKDELRKRGLDTSGLKAALVARLQEDDNSSGGGGGGAAKKEEKEEEKEEEAKPKNKRTLSQAIADLKESGSKRAKPSSRKVDQYCTLSGQVHEDYDCMLNQTNIGQNNNKFYVIQVIKSGATFYTYNRWGRVGERGQDAVKPFGSNAANAIKDFEKKYKDKTGGSWEDRANFEARPGKYTLIELDHEAEDELAEKIAKLEEQDASSSDAAAPRPVMTLSSLAKPTQDLIRLIFDDGMFKSAMADLEIDVKKMPLGAISKTQIAKGYEVLLELDKAVKSGKRGQINELSSRFYTLIPHAFGRRVPPPIDNQEAVQKKMEMLNVLGDIEIAQQLKDEKKAVAKTPAGEVLNPLDKNYKTLKTNLRPLEKKDKMYGIIQTYLNETMGNWRKLEIVDVFEVDRHNEGDRFDAHKDIEQRKLLWHGTNVAVVAAILASGLRIMPHSGGRVGKGIYLASENSKSANYVQCSGNTGIMFLAEAALGKEHHITRDDSSLVTAPPGFDSIVAKGHTEPDPNKDIKVQIDGRDVVVPQGKPIPQPAFKGSSFTQSEYLLYKESQVRIRYLLKLNFK